MTDRPLPAWHRRAERARIAESHREATQTAERRHRQLLEAIVAAGAIASVGPANYCGKHVKTPHLLKHFARGMVDEIFGTAAE